MADSTNPQGDALPSRYGNHFRAIAPLLAANVLFACGLFVHGFLFNFYLKELGTSATVMGNQAAALTIGGMLALVPTGVFVDRVGARFALVTAAALTGIALVAGAMASSPLPIYAAAVAAGAGTSCWRVATAPVLMQVTDRDVRSRAMSWNVALLVATGGLWTALAGALPRWTQQTMQLSSLGGLRLSLVVGAVVTAASAVLFLRAAPVTSRVDSTADRAKRVTTDRLHMLRGVPRWNLIVIPLIALWMTGPALVTPFFNIFFQERWTLPVERVGLIIAAGQWIAALGVAVSGEFAQRVGAGRILAVWLLLAGPLLAILGRAELLSASVPLFLVFGVIAPAAFPLVDQVLLERVRPERYGVVSALRNLATEGSGAIGASVGGRLIVAGSFMLLFSVAGAVSLAAAIALLIALSRRRDESVEQPLAFATTRVP
jgi:DHA1 family multidrug resistance protein-like MFS transporter